MAGFGAQRNWIKYGLAALAIHAAVLALPFSQKAHRMVEQRAIDVVVMRQEIPPAPPPRERERREPPLKRFAARQSVPKVARPLPAPATPKQAEKKEEPPSGGMGNVLDEQIVAEAAPGPTGGEGVGIAGVNVGGGMVGAGSGGTGSGGTGPGSGVGAGGSGPAGPANARFGDADGPQIVYQEKPEYPFAAKKFEKEGKVSLSLTIDEKGKLQKVEVLDATDQMFAASAVEAMKRSKFRPARRGGAPVACRAPYTIRFGF